MAQMVTHGLEGQSRLDQMPGARMAQAVGTAALLWSVCDRPARGHDAIEGTSRERPKRRAPGRKQRTVIAVRPGVANIPTEGVLDRGFERQDLSMPALGTDDLDPVRGPIDILHVQPPNLTRPQAIDGEQSENRPVSSLQRGLAIGLRDLTSDLVPGRSDQQAFITVDAWL